MPLVRRLNGAGIARLTEFLDSLRTNAPQGVPTAILTYSETSEPIGVNVEIELQTFGTRFMAAQYLNDRFTAGGLQDVERDCGLWAWLALFYFDELCPAGAGGRRKPGEQARWVPDVNNYQRYYRHLLAGPYRIYRAHRDDPCRAMALLCGPLDRPGDIVEQLASRQEIVTNRGIMACATRLYIDPASNRPKRGAGSKGAGSPRRLADVLNQFDVTWDLYSLSAEGLLGLLPGEFDRFRPAPTAATG
jgi:hypothetical protein